MADNTASTPPSLPPGGPSSPFLTVRQTARSGRAVFASQDIPSGTLLLKTSPPVVSTIHREYRKEVCGHCFAYDRGREWKIRDSKVHFAFCSDACKRAWREEAGPAGIAAWQAVEQFIQSSAKRRANNNNNSNNDVDSDGDELLPDAVALRPSPTAIAHAWSEGKQQARLLLKLRANQPDSKASRRAVHAALATPVMPDVLALLLAGVLCYVTRRPEWEAMLQLATDRQPYHSDKNLQDHVHGMLQLAAVLPLETAPRALVEIPLLLLAHEMHNSFGIRSLEDEGDEFFGYGVWPEASYYNHACGPNLAKERIGRSWEFRAKRDISEGEELCISYLGGEEAELNVFQRRRRLQETWGFDCECQKCMVEDLD